MSKRVWSFLIVIALLSGCETVPKQILIYGAPQDKVLEIHAYRVDERSRMLVDVMVNGIGPFPFIIDTGASRTLLYEDLREELGFEYTDDDSFFVHGAIISQERPALAIESIAVGEIAITNVQSFSIKRPAGDEDSVARGILGLDFLAQYALFVDVDEQIIVFAESGYTPPQKFYTSVPIVFDDLGLLDLGVPLIEARINGTPIEALLDLGAERTIMNWASADFIGVDVRRFLRGRYEFGGIFSTIPIVAGASGAYISIGERFWEKMNIDIANLPIFKTLKREDSPMMLISAGQLRQENFIIDFPAEIFFLEADKSQRFPDLSEGECVNPNGGIISFCARPTKLR